MNGVISIREIQDRVCHEFGISRVDLLSERRAQRFARPRQAAMYLALKLTRRSTGDVGQAFGRDHSTVMHAETVIVQLLGKDGEFAARLDRLETLLTGTRDHKDAAEAMLAEVCDDLHARLLKKYRSSPVSFLRRLSSL